MLQRQIWAADKRYSLSLGVEQRVNNISA